MSIKIEVTSPKTGREVILDMDFGTSFEDRVEKFGKDVVDSSAVRQWATDAGNAARRYLNNAALTIEQVLEKMAIWKPGVAMPRSATTKDPVGAFIASLGTMSEDDLAKEMDRIKEAIRAKKAAAGK
jgi:hypothetical protein